MRLSPGLAIGWQFWRRHRVGIIASAAVVLTLAVAAPVVAASAPLAGQAIAAVLAAVPAGFVASFFMNALLFADEAGNLASGFPRRAFTLPLPTRSLVVWPMLYAASAVMLLWLVTAGLIFRPLGFRLPLAFPGVTFVAAMAWLQAVTWFPLGAVWLRIASAVVALVGVVVPAGLLKEAGVGDGWVIFLMSAEAALAFVVACVGVERDRRGEVWRPSFGGFFATSLRRPPERFRSAAAAQAWYERRCHGAILPTFAAVNGALLVGVGLFSAAAGRGEAVTTLTICGAILGLGAMAATSLGGTAARTQPLWVREKRPLPFVMIRPHTSGAIAAAKLRMLARAACVTAAVAIGCAAVLVAADGGRGLAEVWRILVARGSAGTAAAVLLLAAVLYPATLWRQATDTLAAGLTGRRWVGATVEVAGVVLFFGLVAGAAWVATHPAVLPGVLAALPWLLGGAVALKAGVAASAFRAAARRGLLSGRAAAGAAAVWLGFFGVVLTLGMLLSGDGLGVPAAISPAVVPLGAALFAPLVRFGLAPLAVDAARHR